MTTPLTTPYNRVVEYHFEADNIGFALTAIGELHVEVEETRKNGQEDTHFFGEMTKTKNGWKLVGWSREHLEEYEGKGTADALEAYLDKHGVPGG